MIVLKEFRTLGVLHDPTEAMRLAEGWGEPEAGFRWMLDETSRLTMPAPEAPGDYVLLMTLDPFVVPGGPDQQRLAVCANGEPIRQTSIRMPSVIAAPFHHSREAPGEVEVVFDHPDCTRPCEVSENPDFRRLAFSVSDLRLLAATEMPSLAPSAQDPLAAERSRTPLSDQELMRFFASVGDNCEFGLVQRRYNAELMDLFRFAAVPLATLADMLAADFAGVDAPENLEVQLRPTGINRREFIVWNRIYPRFEFHAWVHEGEQSGARVFVREHRKLSWLVRLMREDLSAGSRILVVKRNDPTGVEDVLPIVRLLRRYGPNWLLWVEQARNGETPGTVELLEPGFMKAHIGSFAPYDWADDRNADIWLTICRGAYEIWRTAGCAASAVVHNVA